MYKKPVYSPISILERMNKYETKGYNCRPDFGKYASSFTGNIPLSLSSKKEQKPEGDR